MQPKDYVSIVAVVISLISLVITLLQKRSETKRTIRSQLTDVITDLDSVFDEDNKITGDNTNASSESSLQKRRSFLNGRKRFLARQAIFLMDQMPKLVTDFEYNAVADAFHQIGEFDEANSYYEKAIERANRTYYKSIIMRAYAQCLFNQQKFQEARKYYQESINLAVLDSDPHIYHTAETYERWARMEATWSFAKEAKVLFEKANSVYAKLSNSELQNEALSRLRTLEEETLSQKSEKRVTSKSKAG
jgi:tetratricopeptide (TPR) repeat protein